MSAPMDKQANPNPEAPPPYQEGEKGGAPPYPGGNAAYPYPPPPAGQQGYWQPQQQPPAGYPANPGGYQQQYWTQHQHPGGSQQGYPVTNQPPVHATTTTVHVLPTMFRDMPVPTQCPNCHNQVTTEVSHEAGAMAWLMCFIMFLVGLWCCCCIPFCVDGLMDSDHHCPTCRHRIAHYSPL